MSFDMPINQVIRYAYNTFASADAVCTPWIGAVLQRSHSVRFLE
ncbi:hypothetical protein ACT7DE_19360 [Bacillus paranthracis]